MDNFGERIQTLKELIDKCNNIVFFGGAGVSTESGIPDFRSKDGLYNTPNVGFEDYTPEYLLSHSCLYNKPNVFYEFYRQKLDVRNISPNITHNYLANLENQGKLKAVITQNIDGLHQKAGSRTVYEIHGTTMRNYCTCCGKEYPANYIFDSKTAIPKCDCSGNSMIRPDVTLYEESLPVNAWKGAVEALQNADLMIVAGTSLTVYPASSLLSEFMGEYLVIINRDPTEYDLYATLLFHEELKDVFGSL